MKNLLCILSVVLAGALVPGAECSAQERLPGAIEKPAAVEAPPKLKEGVKPGAKFRPRLAYKPPRLKAPKVSTGPGARGSGEEAVTLSLLTPEHVGLTTLEQPRLFWFQSRAADRPMEVTLVVPGREEAVLDLAYEKAPAGELQELDLKEHGVVLQPGVTYRWSVALILDPARRSNDLVASGMIERVEPSEKVREGLSLGTEWEKAAVCAGEGIWYDAVDWVARLEGRDRWEGLGLLAEQVGLKVLAGYCESRSDGY